MRRYEWSDWTDAQAAYRRAGGRRRYNALRRRQADVRRAAIVGAMDGAGPAALLFLGRLSGSLARAFGVHRTTIWRDLRRILIPPAYSFHGPDGELLFTLTRACQGGPVLSVEDADGNEIRGKARRDILKSLPRYHGRRR